MTLCFVVVSWCLLRCSLNAHCIQAYIQGCHEWTGMRFPLLKLTKRLAQSLALLVLFTSASLLLALVNVRQEMGEETPKLNWQMVKIQSMLKDYNFHCSTFFQFMNNTNIRRIIKRLSQNGTLKYLVGTPKTPVKVSL